MRRHQNTLSILLALPWWINFMFAGISFSLLKWGLPLIAGRNEILRAIAGSMQTLSPYAAVFFLVLAAIGIVGELRRMRLLDTQTGIESIRAMSWQNFERLVGEVYRRQGFTVQEVGGGGADGGVDLVLLRGREKWVVQCKRWRTASVGVSLVRELYGVMVAEGASSCVFVSSGFYSKDAVAFAHGKPILLVDGNELVRVVRSVHKDAPIPAAPPSIEERPPLCPRCGKPMVLRVAKKGVNAGHQFWGCATFPTCNGVRDML